MLVGGCGLIHAAARARAGKNAPASNLQILSIKMQLPPRVHTYGIQVSADYMGLCRESPAPLHLIPKSGLMQGTASMLTRFIFMMLNVIILFAGNCVIGTVLKGSIAAHAGIKVGDKLLAINGAISPPFQSPPHPLSSEFKYHSRFLSLFSCFRHEACARDAAGRAATAGRPCTGHRAEPSHRRGAAARRVRSIPHTPHPSNICSSFAQQGRGRG